MAATTTIDRLAEHVGQTVTLAGWLYNRRSSGKIVFLIVRDGTGLCQCVVEKSSVPAEVFETADHLGQESSLEVTGTVRAESRSIGGYELATSDLKVIHRTEGYPITPKSHGVEFLMQHRHLWLRSRRQWVIMRVRATLVDAIRRYFNDRGFVLIDTPIFTPSAGEGAQTLFEVDYFGRPVYLAQTGQLYVEAACMAHRRVYCFGPTFRAEKSKTRRHLTEFWMVEPEIAFCDLNDVIDLAEDFVRTIVKAVLAKHRADLEFLGRDLSVFDRIDEPFDRITYSQAAELLRSDRVRKMLEDDLAATQARIDELKRGIAEKEQQRAAGGMKKWKAEKLAAEIIAMREQLDDAEQRLRNIPRHMELAANFQWGSDLGGSDETIIARLHARPVFVTHYPRQCKAFYMKRNADDPRLVDNFDLLAPEGYGEIIGGSQREDDYDALVERMKEENLPLEPYQWYLDLRRYGSVPHGGFGLGVERTLAWICGLRHVRETIPFPRMLERVEP